MEHVYRRPWKTWRRDKPKSTFKLPPDAVAAANPDVTAYGMRRVISRGFGTGNFVYRRPWGEWGGARSRMVALRTTQGELTDRNTDKWWRQTNEPVRFKPHLPAALHPHFGFVQAGAGDFGFGETILMSGWYPPLSQPIILRKDLERKVTTAHQWAHFEQPWPDISIGWFNPLNEPIRQHPDLARKVLTAHQPTAVFQWWSDIATAFDASKNIGWFNALSQPAAHSIKPFLFPADQNYYWDEPFPEMQINWFVDTNLPPQFMYPRSLPTALHQSLIYSYTPVPGLPWAKGYIIL